MNILFDTYEFEGLKFSQFENYPWENKIERKDFYANLIEENTNYNKEKLLRFLEKETSEKIHISLSRSFIFGIISIFCLILAGIILFSFFSGAIIIGIVSLVALFLKFIYKRKANLDLSILKLTYSLINSIL